MILTTFVSSLNLRDVKQLEGPLLAILLLLRFRIMAEYKIITKHVGIAIRQTSRIRKYISCDFLLSNLGAQLSVQYVSESFVSKRKI